MLDCGQADRVFCEKRSKWFDFADQPHVRRMNDSEKQQSLDVRRARPLLDENHTEWNETEGLARLASKDGGKKHLQHGKSRNVYCFNQNLFTIV